MEPEKKEDDGLEPTDNQIIDNDTKKDDEKADEDEPEVIEEILSPS